MSASHSLKDFQDYLPLARIVYPESRARAAGPGGSGPGAVSGAVSVPEEIAPSRVHELLARLFCAAARGEGAMALSDAKLGPRELEGVKRLEDLFVVDGTLLLLPRYASQLQAMRGFFARRLGQRAPRFSDAAVRGHLDALLPAETLRAGDSGEVLFDSLHQRLAVAALVDARVGVLTGGPGTGKTTTAAALLAVQRRLEPGLTADGVLVAAPTGKAACRIGEALTRATGHLRGLGEEEKTFLRSIRCVTLHRALEWGPEPPEKGGPFRRNRLRKLEARVVLVDEASMVDLSLMHALLEALPEESSLLLLGDSDQLKSVEVGGILAELVMRSALPGTLGGELESRLCVRLGLESGTVCAAFREGMPAAQAECVQPPLADLSFGLKYSRRAMNAPWVLRFAELARPEGKAGTSEVRRFLQLDPSAAEHIRWVCENASRRCLEHCEERWGKWLQMARSWTGLFSAETGALDVDGANAALRAMGGFQLLCSTNAQVEAANLAGTRLLSGVRRSVEGHLPHGCPILVTANNRALGLSNGDVGIALGREAGAPALVGLFAGSDGVPRAFALAQLPPHQPAFGLTIHKSQGSEWAHIGIQLPEHAESRLLTRNLLYTAITRSSLRIDLFGPEDALEAVLATS